MLSGPDRTTKKGMCGMYEPQACQQLVRKQTPAGGGGADSDARHAIRRNTGDHGLHPDQEHDEEPSRSFLLILLRALGAIHT